MGRPSEFTPGRGDLILERLAVGETLRSICKDSEMPGETTVYRWLEVDADFRALYARARIQGADAWHDEVLDVSREATPESSQADRLRVDSLKWAAGKAHPRKYGERIAHEVSGADGAPVRLEHGIDPDPDRLAALATLLGEITGSDS